MKTQASSKPYQFAQPLIQSLHWHIHEIVWEKLKDKLPAGWALVAVFQTRLSCIFDPDSVRDRVLKNAIKDATIDYLVLAVRVPAEQHQIKGPPIPLIAIDITEKAIQKMPPDFLFKSDGIAYARLSEENLESPDAIVEGLLNGENVKTLGMRVRSEGSSMSLIGSALPERREILHRLERMLFLSLVEAAQPSDMLVVGQPSLDAIIDLEDGSELFAALALDSEPLEEEARKYLRRHPVDFVLCSAAPYAMPLVLVHLDGSEKYKKEPQLKKTQEKDQARVIEAAGLTLCRIQSDERKGWNWPRSEFDELARAIVAYAEKEVRSADFLLAVRDRLSRALNDLGAGSQRRRQRARDARFLFRYQLDRIAQLERDLDRSRAFISEMELAMASQDAMEYERPEERMAWEFESTGYDEDRLNQAENEWKINGLMPPLSDLGLKVSYRWGTNALGENAFCARLEWLDPSTSGLIALPAETSEVLKITLVGLGKDRVLEEYTKVLEQRLRRQLSAKLREFVPDLVKLRRQALKNRLREFEIAERVEKLRDARELDVLVRHLRRDLSTALSLYDRNARVAYWGIAVERTKVADDWRAVIDLELEK